MGISRNRFRETVYAHDGCKKCKLKKNNNPISFRIGKEPPRSLINKENFYFSFQTTFTVQNIIYLTLQNPTNAILFRPYNNQAHFRHCATYQLYFSDISKHQSLHT